MLYLNELNQELLNRLPKSEVGNLLRRPLERTCKEEIEALLVDSGFGIVDGEKNEENISNSGLAFCPD